jgi:hypothetical protein
MLPENRLAELGNPKLVFLPSPQGLSQTAWDQLMDYVAKGGTLLVTGPVNRDEHWQPVDRLTPLGIKAEVGPLILRGSHVTVGDGDKTLPYDFTYPAAVQQSSVETMRFSPQDPGCKIPAEPCILHHGSGRILWISEPIDFADGYESQADMYAYALREAGVAESYKPRDLTTFFPYTSPAVLAFPTQLENAVLYSFSNESADDQPIDITDNRTHAHIQFTLGAQRGAMLLLDLQGKVLSSYGRAAVATR